MHDELTRAIAEVALAGLGLPPNEQQRLAQVLLDGVRAHQDEADVPDPTDQPQFTMFMEGFL